MKLAEKGWVYRYSKRLAEHYRFLRKVEHLLQMVNDAQTTHCLKRMMDFWLANFMMLDHTVFKEKIINALKSVHDLTESFFNPEEGSIPKNSFSGR